MGCGHCPCGPSGGGEPPSIAALRRDAFHVDGSPTVAILFGPRGDNTASHARRRASTPGKAGPWSEVCAATVAAWPPQVNVMRNLMAAALSWNCPRTSSPLL
jgi:hypothetical protein